MVIDLIPLKLLRKPWIMILLGFLYASFGVVTSLFFEQYSSLLMVFVTVLAGSHIIIKLNRPSNSSVLKRHLNVLAEMGYLFGGIFFGFLMWFLVLGNASSTIFSLQLFSLRTVHDLYTFPEFLPSLIYSLYFNLRLFLLCFLFSFAFGVGGLFILVWNASVLASGIGQFLRETVIGGYVQSFLVSFLYCLTHSGFELASYVLVGISGSLFSALFSKLEPQEARICFKNAMIFFAVAGVLLLIGSVIKALPLANV